MGFIGALVVVVRNQVVLSRRRVLTADDTLIGLGFEVFFILRRREGTLSVRPCT